MKNFFFCCFAMLLFGCKPNTSEPINSNTSSEGTAPSEAQQKAVSLTGTALGGQATGNISRDGKAFELTISNSITMQMESDLVPLHAAHAVWVFYKNSGNEKPTYESITIKSDLKDTVFTYAYSLEELAIVQARMPAFEAAADLLIKGDYTNLYALFDPVVMGATKVEGLKDYCMQIETTYGKPQSYEFIGFAFNKTTSGQDFLSLAGKLKRQIKDTPLNIAVDLTKPELKGSLNSIKFDY